VAQRRMNVMVCWANTLFFLDIKSLARMCCVCRFTRELTSELPSRRLPRDLKFRLRTLWEDHFHGLLVGLASLRRAIRNHKEDNAIELDAFDDDVVVHSDADAARRTQLPVVLHQQPFTTWKAAVACVYREERQVFARFVQLEISHY
jgi:hypothetical protein